MMIQQKDFITRYEKAIELRDTSNTADAIALFRELLSELESNPNIWKDDEVIISENGTHISKAFFYDDFAYALGDNELLEEALQMESKALEQLSKEKNRSHLEVIYLNFSDYAMQLKNFKEALLVLQKGIQEIESNQFKHRTDIVPAIYINVGLSNYFLGNADEAEKYLKIAANLLETGINYEEFNQDSFEANYFLSEIYKEKGNNSEYEKFKNQAKELLTFISADEITYSATIYPEKIQEKVIDFHKQNSKN
ncbi:tetratricopeptide repeat protein [Capnocytophaga cynodegmi]|uniref:hypothetical protein n=1 Tax=Capnocytophaga cynodegmi TaxID=28189 RepID=UPI003863A505